jgi:hypothetical protein
MSDLQQFAHSIFQPIMEAVALLAAGLVVAVLRRVAAKLGITVTAAQEDAIRSHAADAVRHAEEWGAKQASNKLSPLAADKYREASQALRARFPKLTDADIERYIHSALYSSGLGAAAEKWSRKSADELLDLERRINPEIGQPKGMPVIVDVKVDGGKSVAAAVAAGSEKTPTI